MKQDNFQTIFFQKISLNKIKKNKILLQEIISYIYDYFSKFENLKLNKVKLRKILLEKIADKRNIYFIIKNNENTIGLVHIYLVKQYIDLCLIYLKKEFRNKGIGQKIVNDLRRYFRKRLKDKKIKYFRIEINSKNYFSQKFFEKLGAQERNKTYLLKI